MVELVVELWTQHGYMITGEIIRGGDHDTLPTMTIQRFCDNQYIARHSSNEGYKIPLKKKAACRKYFCSMHCDASFTEFDTNRDEQCAKVKCLS